jgi:hypothetical protein
VALMGGAEAWRLWRGGSLPARGAGSILRPALLFAVMLGGMSLSWQSLCHSFTDRLAACPGPVQMHEELSPLERESALNHWSATSLSLLLQGWNPHKVHVWDGSLQRAQTGFCICPQDDFVWTDRAVKLAWIGKLALP